jgi:hypothetical protein
LTVRGARVITYSVVGLFTFFAVRMTPPIARSPGALLATTSEVSDSPAAFAASEAMISPVVVVASNKETVDTLTVSGTIQSSLFSALDKSGDGSLPRSARAELAFSLADIFEYRVDMSKDLQVGDKFHILVERLQKPNGSIIINKILGAKLALSGNEIEAIRFDSRAASGQ